MSLMGWSEEEGCPARSAGEPALTAWMAGCLCRGQSTVILGQVRTVVVRPELENTSVRLYLTHRARETEWINAVPWLYLENAL